MVLSEEHLRETINELRRHSGDYTECEVMRGRGGVPTLGETLCAFGNMPDGGTIIIGLDEASGFIATGIADLAAMKHGIAHQAREAVHPPVAVTFQDFIVDGNDVIVCTVAGLPLPARPCEYQGRAYLRQADGDYLMSDVEIQMIEDRKRQAELDHSLWIRDDAREVPDSGIDDLDDTLVDSLLRNARAKSSFHGGKPDEVVLRNLGVVSKGGRLTVAGAYVLGEYPQRFLPSWSATAAVQLPGDVPGRTRDLQHFEGPLPTMFTDIRDWVGRNIHTTIGYRSDGNAVDETELPAVAVRELVANALVHRDLSPLSHGKRVEIRLTGDKLTVSNPGGLRGITTAQLGHSGGKRAVNETVYGLCEKVTLPDGTRLIEGEGGGIREARERMTTAGLKPLRFHDTGVSFIAIVSRRKLLSGADLRWLESAAGQHRLDQEQRIVLASMHHGQVWTNKMVRDEFDRMDSREATSLLQDLVSRNLAVSMGERGGARYRIADHLGIAEEDTLHVVASGHRSPDQVAPADANTDDGGIGPQIPNVDSLREALSAADTTGRVADLVSATGLSERQIRYSLALMREAGQVTAGPGRPARWTLNSPIRSGHTDE